MSNTADVIRSEIRDRIVDVLSKNSTPVADAVVQQVATKVNNEIAPVVINANNAEKWYQSRVILGLITTGIGVAAQQAGLQISNDDIQLFTTSLPDIIHLVGSLMEVSGLLLAAVGRIKGASMKPLFSGK